jgi:hypothetical protein
MEISKLAINKKITAFFADGTSKMNLGIATVVGLLNGIDKVPVAVAPVQRASRLLTDLAESAGRIVEQADEGVFLVQSAEPVIGAVTEAPGPVEVMAQPQPVVAAGGKVAPDKASRKYPTLTKGFFNGSIKGQIISVYKTREANPAKVLDFRAALANGDCLWGETPLAQPLVEKATALGLEVQALLRKD